MPRTHGDGFLHIKDVDYIVAHDEALLVYKPEADCEVVLKIGRNVARLIADGDTIQVSYGSIPNAVMSHLGEKKHLGVHTELISRGIVELLKKGVVDNSRKTINRGKTVASFCMGGPKTYAFVHNNPAIEFRVIDYTNDPMVIAQHENMTAINSAVEIDMTGQASAESLGGRFFSGIGGQADFMRGALMAKNGKTILAMPSTARGDTVSRIVPYLKEGQDAGGGV
jgi:acyl-CoA hydrolase